MDLTLSAEQEELRKVVRDFLAERSPESEVRRLMATDEGYDAAVWQQLAGQLGLPGLAIPEEYGGSGYGYAELGVVFEEMGRALFCAPYFSTVALAAETLLRSGDDQAKADLLPGIADGSTIATLALTEESGRWDEAGVTLAAEQADGGWWLTGVKTYVLDGHVADLLLVAARAPEGVTLFAVTADAAGLTRTALPTMDQTRKQARVELAQTPARPVGRPGEGWAVLEQVLATAAILLANEQVGGAARTLEMSVEHAKNRIQFGRPIGSFQAIKHKCADMLVDVEQARSAARYGTWALDVDDPDLLVAASLAKAFCSDAYTHCAGDNIQIHGGIGFTWEHPAHLYFKRAKTDALLLGSATYHRGLLADRLGV